MTPPNAVGASHGSAIRCHRCLQPVPHPLRRCPNCREVVRTGDARRFSLYLAVLGIVAVLALVGLGLYLSPPSVDPDNHLDDPPSTAPPKPAKKPPLN